MKLEYITPEIELDDFVLEDKICANLYGGRNAEFYAIGSGSTGTSGETFIPDVGEDGDDIFPTKP